MVNFVFSWNELSTKSIFFLKPSKNLKILYNRTSRATTKGCLSVDLPFDRKSPWHNLALLKSKSSPFPLKQNIQIYREWFKKSRLTTFRRMIKKRYWIIDVIIFQCRFHRSAKYIFTIQDIDFTWLFSVWFCYLWIYYKDTLYNWISTFHCLSTFSC